MKKELTMTMVIFLFLIAVSVCFRQVFLNPAHDFLNYSYLGALIAAGTMLLALFGLFIKQLFTKTI